MTRAEINTFIKTGVDSLKPAVEYGRGRISEFNSIRNHLYPAAWFETSDMSMEINGATNVPNDTWEINLHVCKKDTPDSMPVDYEDLIDQCDGIAQTLQFKYNKIVSGYKLMTLSEIKREPFVKKFSDCLTGVLMSFQINTPDLTDQSENCE